jgi:hypothetical protein
MLAFAMGDGHCPSRQRAKNSDGDTLAAKIPAFLLRRSISLF